MEQTASTQSQEMNVEGLERAKKLYDQALVIICHAEIPGHKSGVVNETLNFLKSCRDGISAELDKLNPKTETEKTDPKTRKKLEVI